MLTTFTPISRNYPIGFGVALNFGKTVDVLKVLVVDDEESNRELALEILQIAGLDMGNVEEAGTKEDALANLAGKDLVILDNTLLGEGSSDNHGQEIMDKIFQLPEDEQPKVLFWTSTPGAPEAAKAKYGDKVQLMNKPIKAPEMLGIFQKTIDQLTE